MNPKGRLTIEEREQIALMLAKDYTYMQIASTLQRAPSTIGREVYRNYHQRPLKVKSNPLVSSYIYEKMQLLWSPYQISKQMTKDIGLTVSHETIYQYIYVQTKGELKKS